MEPKELYEAIDLLDMWSTCFDYKRYVHLDIEGKSLEACTKLRNFVTNNDTARKHKKILWGILLGYMCDDDIQQAIKNAEVKK